VGKHNKKTDYNQTPYDPDAPEWLKARDFDQQYNGNRQYTTTPYLDSHRQDKPKGRHKK
jgi:hypothetical protein